METSCTSMAIDNMCNMFKYTSFELSNFETISWIKKIIDMHADFYKSIFVMRRKSKITIKMKIFL